MVHLSDECRLHLNKGRTMLRLNERNTLSLVKYTPRPPIKTGNK